MAKLRQLQTNFTSGVVDPKIAAREDIVFFYNGLQDGKNLLVIPQGGATVRPAKQFIQELTPQISEIDLSGATITAPEGGTAANVHDDDDATVVTTSGNIGTTNPFVIVHVDFGSATSVTAVDVINYLLSSGSLDGEFFVQYSTDDMNWSNFGTAFNVDAVNRSRRLRNSSGAVSAQYWRVARVGATDTAATVSIAEVRFWEEAEALSNARLVPFAFSTEEAYMFVISDQNIDVLKGVEYTGSISVPHTSNELSTTSYTQSLDTMLLFQKDVAPWRIFRQGGDDEFDFRYVEFENIPQYDYGAGTGGVNEVQLLNDGGTLVSGDKFTVLLEGERTATITAAGRAATAANIQAALRALSNTSSDGITVADASGDGFTVTFAGDDGLRPWDAMSVSVNKGSSVWSTARTTKGQLPGEDIMSDARGWPRTGAFHQARLHLGGITGVPDAWIASVVGDEYNLDIDVDDATKGLLIRAETDQVSAIYHILVGRHLTFFTNDGEFYVPSEKIDEEVVMRFTTDAGSKEGLRAYRLDGALVFLQGVKDESDPDREIATSLREFIFEETLQAYKNPILSKFSAHLIKNPVDMTLRRSLSTDDADVVVLANEDGTGVNYTTLREDAVNAFVPMTSRGDKFLAVAVDKQRRVYFIMERTIDATVKRFVEVWNEDLNLDCGGILTMTYENVTAASDGQAAHVWTFSSPASADEIGVRINGGRLAAHQYSVDLGAKTVTLNSEFAADIVAGDTIRISKMVNQVTGIDHLDGETINTFIDGSPGDSYTVSSGTITLNDYADTEIQYGFEFEASGKLMPFRIPETETLANEKIRNVNAIFSLYNTIGLEFKANGGNWQELPLSKTDSAVLDRSAEDLLFTGEIEAEGLLGVEVGAPLEFRRPNSGPMTVLGIVREVAV